MSNFDIARHMTVDSDITLINKAELADRLGISLSTVYRWAKKGVIPTPMKSPITGKTIGWLTSSIVAWELEQNIATRYTTKK